MINMVNLNHLIFMSVSLVQKHISCIFHEIFLQIYYSMKIDGFNLISSLIRESVCFHNK